MIDRFTFPTISGRDTKEKVEEIIRYLYQFKEELEFALEEMSTDKATAIRTVLESYGLQMRDNLAEQEDINQQLSHGGGGISVSDVINSPLFKEAIGEINERLNEVFQSVSEGKSMVASAITDKGIDTANDATFATMAENIGKISGGGGGAKGIYSSIASDEETYGILLPQDMTIDSAVTEARILTPEEVAEW